MTSHRFRIGDHLRSPRTLYTHHGIYLGRDLVIHYAGFASEMKSGAIEITTLDEFTQGQGASVVPHPDRKWNVDETIERAYGRLGEDWYSLLFNNCEHFVYWCIEGKHKSPQVETYVGYTMNALTYAAIKRQAPEMLTVVMTRLGVSSIGMGTMSTPISSAMATSVLSSSVSSNIAPAIAKAVTNGAVAAGVTSTASYSGVAALAGVAGLTAPISLPTALVAGAAVGIGTYLYNKIFD